MRNSRQAVKALRVAHPAFRPKFHNLNITVNAIIFQIQLHYI